MNVMGILFTNDGNIGELTNKRTMASLPFGGRYRQVDFGLSNFAFAGIRHAGRTVPSPSAGTEALSQDSAISP